MESNRGTEVMNEAFDKITGDLDDIIAKRTVSLPTIMKLYNSLYASWVGLACHKDQVSAVREMYRKLESFLYSRVCTMFETFSIDFSETEVLSLYMKTWNHYLFFCKAIKNIFSFADRYLESSQRHNKDDDFHAVYGFAFCSWRKVLGQGCNPIVGAILSLIRSERDSGIVSPPEVSNVLSTFIEVSFDKTGVYRHEQFEKLFGIAFISDTECYYRSKFEHALTNNSFIECIYKVDSWFAHEKGRRFVLPIFSRSVAARLSNNVSSNASDRLSAKIWAKSLSSLSELMYRFVQNSIEDYTSAICSEFPLIEKTKFTQDFWHFFQLLTQKSASFDCYVDNLTKCFVQHGIFILTAQPKTTSPSLEVYVKIFLQLQRCFTKIAHDLSANGANLIVATGPAFTVLVDVIAKIFSTKDCESSKVIAEYCHQIIVESTEDEYEHRIDDLMIFLKYIPDKTGFIELYARKMAERFKGEGNSISISNSAYFRELEIYSKLDNSHVFDMSKLHNEFINSF